MLYQSSLLQAASSGSSAASASATVGGGSSDGVCITPSSVAKLTSEEPQPRLLLSGFGIEGGTSRNMNMNIPLAQKWLPENTHANPLDGSAPLLRQLQKL